MWQKEPVNSVRNSGKMDTSEECDKKTRYAEFWSKLSKCFSQHTNALRTVFIVIFNACILGYLITAVMFFKAQGDCDLEWCDGLGILIIILGLVYLGLLYYHIIKKFFGMFLERNILIPIHNQWHRLMAYRYLKLTIYLLPLIAVIVFLALDTADNTERLKSCIGVVVIMVLGFAFSRHPGQIQWRPVLCGLGIQFVLGLISVRWSVGRSIFQCISGKVATLLAYSDAGSRFVYGDFLIDSGVFVFKSLSVIFFLSFIVQILYYYGVMQWTVMQVGWLLQKSMGTTVCESVNAAASIFLGMGESPLLFKPYIKDLTKSEIHAVMTEGFATVAGSVMAAYINFGVEPMHLLTASIMSAPAALCFSKLFYPEIEQSKTAVEHMVAVKGDENSVLDAATNGALLGIQMVLGIAANLIAFVSFIAFINGVLSWLGMLVGIEALTLEFITGKVFIPLAWIMGVKWEECDEVARLVGIKTIINEFVAYQQMGESKRAGLLSPRSEMIATYALCGFSNPGSIGIFVGALITLAPEKRGAITEVAFRAFIAGSATCFLTASIAGRFQILLFQQSLFHICKFTIHPFIYL
ncbi:Sodium/nucleoside cotransporter 1 [Zootermopsis nevadensis]|uniref:Sodium/nucleoside cotransporter n=1 Tax=Zootermopsis nevadensis TaxID=136037 RepID=A0A067QR39_ZOONE|nr:Sodium/nucleoside cotransporter 1 [Zootermopsis nevadensis]